MAKSHLVYATLGNLAVLISAFTWALGSILFRKLGDKVSPLGMNLGKNIIGILYLGVILLISGIQPISQREFLLLLCSGLLGIAFGDTFFFRALIDLGPRLTLILGTLGTVITVILAVIFLKEQPSLMTWLGISLVMGGVTWVLWEYSPRGRMQKIKASGIKYLFLSIFCTSIGIILAKIGVASVSALEALLIRFLGAAIGLILYGCVCQQIKTWLIPFRDIRLLKFILFTVFIVIFGGFWLFLLGLKYTDASVAAILSSTTPLFILPLAVFMLKEKITVREIIGATVAVSGVILIFLK